MKISSVDQIEPGTLEHRDATHPLATLTTEFAHSLGLTGTCEVVTQIDWDEEQYSIGWNVQLDYNDGEVNVSNGPGEISNATLDIFMRTIALLAE